MKEDDDKPVLLTSVLGVVCLTDEQGRLYGLFVIKIDTNNLKKNHDGFSEQVE